MNLKLAELAPLEVSVPPRPLREEVLELIVNGPSPRLHPCHGYAHGCRCPTCQARARRGARSRVRSDETALMSYAMELGLPIARPAARTILARYGTVAKARNALAAMKDAKLRQAA